MAESFGCCSSYLECSNNRACIHKGDPEYQECQYRKNLEAGRIFFGKNKSNEGEIHMLENIKITININAPELANAIISLAGALSVTHNQTTIIAAPTQKKEESKPKKTEKPVAEKEILPEITEESLPETAPEVSEPTIEKAVEEVSYSLEEVRAKLAAISQSGNSAKVKQLIASFDTDKLSAIPADKYPELMKKAGAIA